MNEGNSLDCGHYVSDVFDSNIGIWWHYDDANITQISDFIEGIYTRESQKLRKKRKLTSGSKDILFVFFIRTKHLIESRPVVFLELINMYKNHHMKKVLK